jgi:hypothetical protein
VIVVVHDDVHAAEICEPEAETLVESKHKVLAAKSKAHSLSWVPGWRRSSFN